MLRTDSGTAVLLNNVCHLRSPSRCGVCPWEGAGTWAQAATSSCLAVCGSPGHASLCPVVLVPCDPLPLAAIVGSVQCTPLGPHPFFVFLDTPNLLFQDFY